ncbi:MAG: hypothetical protein R2729_25900 [Bryobacteraceae bacterium]
MAPAFPALSDDVLRYRWEGEVQSRGGNPYLERPADRSIPAAGFRAGYGPVTELIESGTFRLAAAITDDPARQAFWMKLPAIVFEAATLALLAQALPVRHLVWYAWSPAPVVEFWWNGHNDALPVLCMVAALMAARRDWWAAAFGALGVGIGAKWWPAALVPALVWHAGLSWRRLRCAPLLAAPAVLAAIPYLTVPWREFVENARFMSGFVGGWRNNDSIYGLLLWAADDEYRAKYAAFALIGGAVAWTARWPLERAALGAIVAMLLVSANCHPWYVTWFTPLLVWVRWPPLLVWKALMPLAYVVLVEWRGRGVWEGATGVRWWIWGPVYVAMLIAPAIRRRFRA